MPVKIQPMRRLWEAARKDKQEARFFGDLREALEKGELKGEDFSIRQLFENFVSDPATGAPVGRELADAWAPQLRESAPSLTALVEAGAVETSAFSNITGQIIYNTILNAYQDEQFVFSGMIPTVPTQFNGEKIAGMGRIGDKAEVVGENEAYPTVGINEDWIQTPQTVKRGLIVPVTREAIFFDRTGLILQRAGEVGHWLGINKEKRAIDAVIDENVTTHRYNWKGTSYATFQASTPWVNIQGSNALVDWTDVDAAEQLLAAMRDPWTGEPIMITPRHLIVTRQLLYTARRVTRATTVQVTTPGFATSNNPTRTEAPNPIDNYEIMSSQLLADRLGTDTSWFLGDVSRAVKYMENWPMTVVQAPTNSQKEFENDIVQQYKASERGAFSVQEPRALVKSTA